MSEAALTKKSAWWTLVNVNVFWLGLNFRNNAVGAIFLPVLVDTFTTPDIRNTALGGIRTAGLIIAMLVQPIAGIISDRTISKMGRRRPFLTIGVLFDLLCLLWIASASSYGSLLAAMLFFQAANNISHGPLQSLIPDLIPENQRGAASAIKSIFELLPVVLIGVTIAPLVAKGKFDTAVVITGLFLLAALVYTLITVHEQPQPGRLVPEVPASPALLRVAGMLAGILAGAAIGLAAGAAIGLTVGLAATIAGFGEQAKAIGIALGGITAMASAVLVGARVGVLQSLGETSELQRRSKFMAWVANRLAFLAAITSLQGFLPFFLMYAFTVNAEEAAGMTGTLISVVGVFTLAAALPSGWLADRIGTVRLTAVSGILASLGTLLLLGTVWQPKMPVIYISGLILGLATGLFVTVNWALGTRLVPNAESGRWLGVSNLAGAGAGMVGAGIGGPLADQLNSLIPGSGYFTIFAGYAFLFLLSTACLWPLRKTPGL